MKPFFSALLSALRKYSTKSINKPQIGNAKKPRTSKVNKIEWTDQQLLVFDSIKRKQSVFITGSAGTGKTKLIEEIIKLLRKIHGRDRVFVTAPTGVAACALKGQTLHSFAGVGLAEADAHTLLSRVLSNRRTLKRWRSMRALVIDEISMVNGDFFDKLEYIARGIRSCKDDSSLGELPWGGIQLVVSGDFLQLPPVLVGKKLYAKEFAFEADSWDYSFQLHVALRTIFRQSDAEHIRMLQGIRRGELDPEGLEMLKNRFCDNEDELDETVVRLFPRVEDVDRVNQLRLHGLEEEIIVYKSFDTGKEPWKSQLNQGIAPTTLELCKGARVMLTKNLNVNFKLVNGATGTITGFVEAYKGKIKNICCFHGRMVLPIVKFDSGREQVIKPDKWEVLEGDEILATRLQLPLMLAWAMSIHKSQGMTLFKLHTDLSKAFGYGMVYVALSRLRSLDGLYLSGFKPWTVKAHPKVLEYYKKCFL